MMHFIKNEIVFSIALLLAVLTSFIVPPSMETVNAIDFRTLSLLFALMGVSEGLKASGLFPVIADTLSRKSGNRRRLSLLLILIVFFSSMLFTNDVALLMFVPFSLIIMHKEKAEGGYAIRLVVLETIAANLGSMATPVGNPQNLFICSHFSLMASDFFRTILPYSIISLALILIAFFILLPDKQKLTSDHENTIPLKRKKTALYLAFLFLALLAVFHVLDYRILLLSELVLILIFDRKTLLRIDYILLLTFVCFFIFSANIRSIDAVRNMLYSPMQSHPVLTSAIASQIISNVPSAIRLSPFTEHFEGVLIGTDIGGLGTPIASLASLISLKIYAKKENANMKRYLAVFLSLNVIMLLILAMFTFIF